MAVKKNEVPELTTLNCIGTISVAVKDGDFVAYQKDGSQYIIIAFDFNPDPMTSGLAGRTWVTLNARQFDPMSDSSEFEKWQNSNFDRWFIKGGTSNWAVLEGLTEEEGPGWLYKLEQYYDSSTGFTDVKAIAREISSRIDGKTIGYQMVQERKKVEGEFTEEGKQKYELGNNYVVGDRFWNPALSKPPKKGQNTF